ncbi:MAG TPA: MFS transporter [Burkholderiaceae bacterium]|nr:MFS transporter [Burkholderiaceae bacterium]
MSGTPFLSRLALPLSPAWRVCAAFFLYAFAIGGIFPRLPEIQRALGAAEGVFGLALIGAACGTMVSLSVGARLLERVGHRRALLGLTALLPVCYAFAALARTPLAFFALLLPAGLCIGAIEIVVNLEADRVEHQSGQRFMSRAHGFWSVGFFAAGLLGAALSQLGVAPWLHLALVVPLQALGIALLLGNFEPAPQRASATAAAPARFARPTWGVMALVALTLSAMVLEGAGADWSAIYMRDVFGAAPFVAGLAVAAGAATQALARFAADRFVARHSPVAVARVLLALLAAGTLLVFAAPAGGVALLGFALMGVGTSAIFPLAMSAAAQRTDRAAATNVAALAQISFVAFLLGPPLLGGVAQAFGMRWAFGAGLPLVALSFIAASALRVR